jgi:hypothetical protein
VIIVHSVVQKRWPINGDKNITQGIYDIMITLVLLALGCMKLEMHHPRTQVISVRNEGTSFDEKVWLSAKIRQFENLTSSHKSLMEILKRSGTPDSIR